MSKPQCTLLDCHWYFFGVGPIGSNLTRRQRTAINTDGISPVDGLTVVLCARRNRAISTFIDPGTDFINFTGRLKIATKRSACPFDEDGSQ
jgi:hypothetical protein